MWLSFDETSRKISVNFKQYRDLKSDGEMRTTTGVLKTLYGNDNIGIFTQVGEEIAGRTENYAQSLFQCNSVGSGNLTGLGDATKQYHAKYTDYSTTYNTYNGEAIKNDFSNFPQFSVTGVTEDTIVTIVAPNVIL